MTTPSTPQTDTPIKIAILAMGGQGGGVLADWIVDMAQHAHRWAQTSSVPGVAPRPGATISYLELILEDLVARAARPPVLAILALPAAMNLVLSSGYNEG